MVNEFDPGRIVEALNRHGVEYVVIGGYAAQIYGATRPTRDIDVTPAREVNNLDRLAAALRELEAKTRTDAVEGGLPFDVTGEELMSRDPATMLNVITKHGELDVTLQPQGTAGYASLIENARPYVVGGADVNVASLADVIRSKETAARPKDRDALPELYRLAIQLDHGLSAEEISAAKRAQAAQAKPATEATTRPADGAVEDPRARAARYLRDRGRDAGNGR